MLGVLEVNYEKTTPFKDKITLLQAATQQQLLQSPNPDNLEKIMLKIKLFLEDNQARFEGLLLLQTLLLQCSEGVFQSNAFYWVQSTLGVLEGSDGSNSKELSCSILTVIITNLPSFPELRNNVGENLMSSVLGTLMKTQAEDQWISDVLVCLSSCMREMPTYCSPHKEGIENFLVTHLDCSLSAEVEPIAECYRFLPNISEQSLTAVSYSKYWVEVVEKMLGTLNKLILFLYEGIFAEEPSPSTFPLDLQLPAEPEDSLSAALGSARRFQTVARVLAKVLSSETSFPVEVPVARILLLIERTLSISYPQLTENTKMHLASLIPTIHSSILVVLEALIISCHKFLIVKEEPIGKLLFQQLQKQYTTFNNVSEEVQCSMLRAATYRVMRLWLEKLRPSSLKSFFSELCVQLLKDIEPVAKLPRTRDLMMSNVVNYGHQDGRPHISARGKSKLCMKISACTESLCLLSSMMYTSHHCFTDGSLKTIQDDVVDILLRVQQNHFIPPPYNNEQCRLELYKLFMRIVVHSQRAVSTPLCVAMPIFQAGQRDASIEVSRLCSEASALCLTIVHPERVVYTKQERLPVEPVAMSVAPPELILSGPSVKGSRADDWDVANDHASGPAHQVGRSGKAIRVNLTPAYRSGKKGNDLVLSNVNDQANAKDKEGIVYDIGEDDDYMEDEEEEDDDDVDEEEDEEEEDPHEEEGEEQPEDVDDLDSQAGGRFLKSEARFMREDNSNSNVNGFPVQPINENGFDTSQDSRSPASPRKRKRTTSSEEAVPPKVAASTIEVQENSVQSEVGSEINVEAMIQDFVPYSPDSSKS